MDQKRLTLTRLLYYRLVKCHHLTFATLNQLKEVYNVVYPNIILFVNTILHHIFKCVSCLILDRYFFFPNLLPSFSTPKMLMIPTYILHNI